MKTKWMVILPITLFASFVSSFEAHYSLPIKNENPKMQFIQNKQFGNEASTCSLVDNQGNIWVGTVYKGLWVKYLNTQLYVQPKGINWTTIHDVRNIGQDNKQNIWITAGVSQAPQTLWKLTYKTDIFVAINNPAWNPIDNISGWYCDHQGNIWVGGGSGNSASIWKSTNEGQTFTAMNKPSDNWSMFAMLQDNNNNLWVATFNGGLWESNGGITWTKKIKEQTANTNFVIQDKYNNLWMSAQGQYLYHSSDATNSVWKNIKFGNTSGKNPAQSWVGNLSINKNNNLIIPTGGGLYIGTEVNPIPIKPVPNNPVKSSIIIHFLSIIFTLVVLGLGIWIYVLYHKNKKLRKEKETWGGSNE